MIDEARLRSVDDELAGLGVEPARLEAVVARARASRPTLAEADEALAALGSGFDTKVPEGAVARPASWRQAAAAPVSAREPESGLVEVDEAALASAPLPAVLSDALPAGEGEDRISVEIAVEVTPPSGESDPGEGAIAAAESGPTTDAPPAPLELELEAAPAAAAPEPAAPEPAPEPERVRRGTFPPPHDVAHPSPSSVVPPPPADLDAELASILADELEGSEPSGEEPLEGELAPEPTALFSAEMFGATEEPSLDKLMSEIPPPMAEEAVEIDLDEEVVVEEAAPPPPPRSHAPPPSLTRPPPPPGRSVPPGPEKPGFLGRLLGKKS